MVITAFCLGTVESAFRYLHPLSFTGLAAAALLLNKAGNWLGFRSATP
jgi:hypothetical protein